MGIGHVGIGLDRILPARSKLLLPVSRVRVGFSSFLFFLFILRGGCLLPYKGIFFFFGGFFLINLFLENKVIKLILNLN